MQSNGLRAVQEKVSALEIAHAMDHHNMTTAALKSLRKTFTKAFDEAGFDKDACIFPPPHRVQHLLGFVGDAVHKDIGLDDTPYQNKGTLEGWHVQSIVPTAKLAIQIDKLKSTAGSTQNIFHANLCFDGASMAGAVDKVLGFMSMEPFNKLKSGKMAKGVKSEHNHYMIAAAEMKSESSESLREMFSPWLTDQVDKLQQGLEELKPVIDQMKGEYKGFVAELARLQESEQTLQQEMTSPDTIKVNAFLVRYVQRVVLACNMLTISTWPGPSNAPGVARETEHNKGCKQTAARQDARPCGTDGHQAARRGTSRTGYQGKKDNSVYNIKIPATHFASLGSAIIRPGTNFLGVCRRYHLRALLTTWDTSLLTST